ncbi:MAG TPA: potassium/proton antiporter [Jiangellaceae bacterium]|nr:potassium/proton antiporter [Jiangellaceae bacterium]
MDVDSLNIFLFVGALVLVAAVAAIRFSIRLGLPSLVIYLLIGVAIGEEGIGIHFEDAELAQVLAFAALVVILAEGGLSTRWDEVRSSFLVGLSLATVGVAISTTIMALVGHYVLGLDWTLAVLLGAVFAPTDAAAVFSTLRRVPLRPRLSGALEAESGLNDAPTVVLVVLVSAGEVAEQGVGLVALIITYELVAGAVIGLAVGWLGAQVLRRAALPAVGLYPLLVMTLAVLAYAAGAVAHASGFAAVYVAALVLGNSSLPHRAASRSFAEGLAWVSQIGMFVMLGLLSSPSHMPAAFVPALVAGFALTLFARPLSVFIATMPFALAIQERIFLSWAGLRGAIPVVLATIPLADGAEDAAWLFAVVFIVAVVFTLLQAPPLPWLARLLGVGGDAMARDTDVESVPLDRLHADLVQVRIPARSRLHGVEIAELRLPPNVAVALVIRKDTSFVPEPTTRLQHGDEMLIVAPRRLREATERRIRAVSRSGRLAGWFGDRGRRADDDVSLRRRPLRFRRSGIAQE